MSEPYGTRPGPDVSSLAMERLAEAERELALVRHHQDAKIAELEERVGWFEENELDFRAAAERRPWLAAALRAWARAVRFARLLRRVIG
jgi:hypothetical protein